EHRHVRRRSQMSADAEAIDWNTGRNEPLDFILIQAAARKNLHLLQPGSIKSTADFARVMRESPGIQPHPTNAKVGSRFPGELDDVLYAVLNVVGIDEKDRVRVGSSKFTERLKLTIKSQDIAVRHCSGVWYSPGV